MPATQNIRSFDPLTRSPSVVFFACLFFLCGADQFFATRLWGYNFRWGQALLLMGGLLTLRSLAREAGKDPSLRDLHVKLLAFWSPFFIIYTTAALLSPSIHSTLLKEAWALFNIGLASLVCLGPGWDGSLQRGFRWAVYALAGLLWLEALAVYWFGAAPQPDPASTSFQVHLGPLFVGYVQPSWVYEGTQFFRPNAFYYEPSYAGAALAFALPLLMALPEGRKGFPPQVGPAFVLSAILLCSSRSGILSAVFSLLCLAGWGFKHREVLKTVLKTSAAALVLLAVFSLSPSGLKYIRFISGPLGIELAQQFQKATQSEKERMADIREAAGRHAQIQVSRNSESERLTNAGDDIQVWSRHLFLGNGVTLPPYGLSQGLGQISINTWLEIGVESGIFGLITFLFAVLAVMRESLLLAGKGSAPVPFVLAAWVPHFLVALNLTQTFPRLDYWLIFFFSVSMLVKGARDPGSRPMEGPGR